MLVNALFLAGLTAGAVTVAPANPDSAELRMEVDESAKEIVLKVGPFSLVDRTGEDAHAHHGAGHDTPVYQFKWPVKGWLRGFRINVVDSDGNELPREVMHHMIMVNYDRRQLIYRAAERIMGAGSETADYSLPKSIGVPVPEGTQLGMYVAWHNATGADLEDVHLQITLVYTPHNQVPQPVSTLPVYFDTNLEVGGTNTFDILPGITEKSYEFSVPISGRLLGVSGHMHDFGSEVRLEEVASGKVLTTVKAEREANGKVTGVERHLFGVSGRGLKLEAGKMYRVVGIYDNPTDRKIDLGAMAEIVGIFAPDDIEQWPDLDRSDPVFQRDMASLESLSMEMMDSDHADDHDHEGMDHDDSESHDDHADGDHDH